MLKMDSTDEREERVRSMSEDSTSLVDAEFGTIREKVEVASWDHPEMICCGTDSGAEAVAPLVSHHTLCMVQVCSISVAYTGL